jgi:hypothetical protein
MAFSDLSTCLLCPPAEYHTPYILSVTIINMYCELMPCCNYQVMNKCEESPEPVQCITNHPGFQSIALCPWNLQAVYYGYRQQHGDMTQTTLHESVIRNRNCNAKIP